MNNFNMNWLLNPPNLFGTGRNYNRNTAGYEEAGRNYAFGGYGEPDPDCRPCECGKPGPQGPRGEPGPPGCPGERGPAGPAGYPQNSIFASFSGQDLVLSENAILPLKADISDITENISLSDDYSVLLSPGCYSIYYYISTAMKRHGLIKLTPILNGYAQTAYSACAEAVRRREMLVLSRYFMMEIPCESTLLFAWDSSVDACEVSMNLSVEKLGRQ